MTKKSKLMHAVDSSRYAVGELVRTRCGLLAGDERRTHLESKVTCNTCRKLLGLLPRRDPRVSKRDLDALKNAPRKPARRALKRGLPELLGDAPRTPEPIPVFGVGAVYSHPDDIAVAQIAANMRAALLESRTANSGELNLTATQLWGLVARQVRREDLQGLARVVALIQRRRNLDAEG